MKIVNKEHFSTWEYKGNNIDLVCFYRMIGLEELAGKRKMPT